jgi:hypothetical protein
MTTFLWVIAIIAQLAVLVLAWIGVQKIRDDIRRRGLPYDGCPYHGDNNTAATSPAPSSGYGTAEAMPSRFQSSRSSPAYGGYDAGRPPSSDTLFPRMASPSPEKPRRKPLRKLPPYLRLAADTVPGPVPEGRPRRGFKGNLRRV